MITGRHRIRGRYNLILVDNGNDSHEVDEYIYGRMKYLPELENLPWGDAGASSVLLIDVIPKRPEKISVT
jgi:hypothetical protein